MTIQFCGNYMTGQSFWCLGFQFYSLSRRRFHAVGGHACTHILVFGIQYTLEYVKVVTAACLALVDVCLWY